MNIQSIDELREIFSKSLDIPKSIVVDSLSYHSIAEWDSVAHMALVAAIEDRYAILLDTNDILDLSTFSQAVYILKKYGVEL